MYMYIVICKFYVDMYYCIHVVHQHIQCTHSAQWACIESNEHS